MRTEEEHDQGIQSELIQRLFDSAARMEHTVTFGSEVVSGLIAAWWTREAHLAVERAATAVDAGVPPETAWWLACDDPGFQLAKATADEYYIT